MIKKIQNVSKVRSNVFGTPTIKGVVAPLKRGVETDVNLPHNFAFNGDWTIAHQCLKCNENIQFGSSGDGLRGFVPHVKLNTLFSKFYSESLLESVSNVLKGTKVIRPTTTDWTIITDVSFNDENAEIVFIPKKTVLNYNCSNCGAEYICSYSIGVGAYPERNIPEGRHGKMMIHEIVQIESENGTSFLDLVSHHRNK
ncbi:MAG: hypothetical protein ACJASQ_002114 [Crocinitomicaceae bacterium]|jgi:hypothetical protein